METSQSTTTDTLNTCHTERQQAAHELQNEVNQLLASVLLWIRFAKAENRLHTDLSFLHAEKNLQEAITRVTSIHYTLAKDELICDWQ